MQCRFSTIKILWICSQRSRCVRHFEFAVHQMKRYEKATHNTEYTKLHSKHITQHFLTRSLARPLLFSISLFGRLFFFLSLFRSLARSLCKCNKSQKQRHSKSRAKNKNRFPAFCNGFVKHLRCGSIAENFQYSKCFFMIEPDFRCGCFAILLFRSVWLFVRFVCSFVFTLIRLWFDFSCISIHSITVVRLLCTATWFSRISDQRHNRNENNTEWRKTHPLTYSLCLCFIVEVFVIRTIPYCKLPFSLSLSLARCRLNNDEHTRERTSER